jgi:hypothetical protein
MPKFDDVAIHYLLRIKSRLAVGHFYQRVTESEIGVISRRQPLKGDRGSGDIGSLRVLGVSGGGGPSPEDQPLEVIDEVRHPDLHSSAGDSDGADEEPHSIFLLGEDMLDARSDG